MADQRQVLGVKPLQFSLVQWQALRTSPFHFDLQKRINVFGRILQLGIPLEVGKKARVLTPAQTHFQIGVDQLDQQLPAERPISLQERINLNGLAAFQRSFEFRDDLVYRGGIVIFRPLAHWILPDPDKHSPARKTDLFPA